MNARLTVFPLLVLAAVPFAAGQEQPASAGPQPERAPSPDLVARYEQMAAELKQAVPQREIKINVVPAVQTKLFRADPKLLLNKFVAQFALRRDSASLRDFGGGDFGFGSTRLASQFIPKTREALRTQHEYLLDQCPLDARPDQRMIDFLTSEDCDRDVRNTAMWRGYSEIEMTFRVFAPTAEEAEQRARAIMQLYDCGYTRPVQRLALAEGRHVLEQSRKLAQDLPMLSAAIAAEEAKLAKPSEISHEILTELKAQKVMQTVELAGLNARVKACDAMLGDPKRLEVSTLQSVSDMKVKAEIERVGIKEKLDQINDFIAEGDARNAAQSRLEELSFKHGSLQSTIEGQERRAWSHSALFTHFRPLDLAENRIDIGPVEWVSE